MLTGKPFYAAPATFTVTSGALPARSGLTIKGPTRIYDSELASIGLLFAKRSNIHKDYVSNAYRSFFDRSLELDDADAITSLIGAWRRHCDLSHLCRVRRTRCPSGKSRPCRDPGGLRGPDLHHRRGALLGPGPYGHGNDCGGSILAGPSFVPIRHALIGAACA